MKATAAKGLLGENWSDWGQNCAAEVPVDLAVWTERPAVSYRAQARDRQAGRRRRYPRLKAKNNPKAEVRNV